jgi:uncharacterized protein YndB with AHSA1/START domain
MPATNKLQVIAPKGETIVRIVREFDFPRRLVWEAHTEARHMANWWGPRKYTNHVEVYDVRPGGKWRIVQTDGDQRHVFHGEFREVVAPEKFVQTFAYADFPPALSNFVFEDLGGRTRLIAETDFGTVAGRDAMIATDMESGASEGYERLDELLASQKG